MTTPHPAGIFQLLLSRNSNASLELPGAKHGVRAAAQRIVSRRGEVRAQGRPLTKPNPTAADALNAISVTKYGGRLATYVQIVASADVDRVVLIDIRGKRTVELSPHPGAHNEGLRWAVVAIEESDQTELRAYDHAGHQLGQFGS